MLATVNRRTWALGLVGLLAAAACERPAGESRKGAHGGSVANAHADVVAATATGEPIAQGVAPTGDVEAPASRAGPYINGPPALDGLPAIDLGPRERAQMELSRRLEKRGLKRMREDKFEDATDRFFEAIEVDPGNVNARYNFACALSRLGDSKAAVAMLNQLRERGCGSCLGKVLKARRDTDFDPIRKHKAFISVVADVELSLATPLLAATQIDAWIADVESDATPLSLDPRRKVRVKVGCATCASGKAERGTVRGAKGLRSWVERKRRAFSRGIGQTGAADCKGKCCTFAEPDRASVSPDMLFVQEVCFRVEAGRVASLSRLGLNRYPAAASPVE